MALFSRGKNNGVSEELVWRALSSVKEPELGGDLVSRKMIKNLKVEGDHVSFLIELTTPACPLKDQIQQECEAALEQIDSEPVDKQTAGPAEDPLEGSDRERFDADDPVDP